MKTLSGRYRRREGSILGVVMVVVVAVSVLVLSLFHVGGHSWRETDYDLRSAQAFWLAEAGRARCIRELYNLGDGVIAETQLNGLVPGTLEVVQEASDPNLLIAIGTAGVGDRTVTRRIQIEVAYVARPYETAIYAGNDSGIPWTLQLRGTGAASPPPPTVDNLHEDGGRDSVLGDIELEGNLYLAESSFVDVPSPNRYGVNGDVTASGTITLEAGASISGSREEWAFEDNTPDLSEMDYANLNDYDVAKIFNDAGIESGRLPNGHPLENVLQVEKNPPDRSAENDVTEGDDFYFEPVNVSAAGNIATGESPLSLGEDKIYYVDGHVWFHSKSTYGFEINGRAAIVSTRDIHISDNIEYADRSLDGDMLALVALGQYTGDVLNGYGNIYFGDPTFGTLYIADAFMFANNNFYYNTRSSNQEQEEPGSGFKVFGNFVAANQVVILRDWYKFDNASSDYRAAEFDLATGQWLDVQTGTELTENQVSSLRHYAMQVVYDDRIRVAATQMSGLPRGKGKIFAGLVSWSEINTD